MIESIKTQDLSTEFYTDERCFITELSNSTDDAALSVARARVAPGVTTRWHRLKTCAERYYILSGTGKMEVGDLPPTVVAAGDTVLIPAMSRQRITNTGDNDLLFLALCTPRFFADDYEDVDPAPADS